MTFILLLVVLIILWPSVPEPLKTVVGIVVGVVVLWWVLSLAGVPGLPHLTM